MIDVDFLLFVCKIQIDSSRTMQSLDPTHCFEL
jgi:hypothetical protein